MRLPEKCMNVMPLLRYGCTIRSDPLIGPYNAGPVLIGQNFLHREYKPSIFAKKQLQKNKHSPGPVDSGPRRENQT